MKRVLMVCLGNICRSPMAHGVFADLVSKRGLAKNIEVDSCGTAAYHAGERPDRRTMAVLQKHGIALNHRARQLQRGDYDQFDLILCMDQSNLSGAQRLFGVDGSDAKVRLCLEPTTGEEVPDPYYGGPGGFDHVYDLLDESLRIWLDRIQ